MSSCVDGLNAGNEYGLSGRAKIRRCPPLPRQGYGPDYRKITTCRDGEL
jgi:hypothetical protein